MKLDATAALAPSEVTDFTKRAEATGIDGVMLAEMQHEVFVGLDRRRPGDAAARVDQCGVAIALARSPMVLAQQAWDIQALSGGRLRVGLGSQVKAHITSRFSMPWTNPRRRCASSSWPSGNLALLAGGVLLRHAGRYYRHWLMTPAFNPGPIEPGRRRSSSPPSASSCCASPPRSRTGSSRIR